MYKTRTLLSLLLVFAVYCNAQNVAPAKKWEKTFGELYTNEILSGPNKISLIDREGDYLIASTALRGFSGLGNTDIWISKLDTQRNTKWSVLLGGSQYDRFGSLQWAHESGYIVTGSTSSNNNHVSGNHGGDDVWVVRLNNDGNIIWQKCYGGTGNELGTYIEKTSDGYILIGNTNSNDGNVSGVHQGSVDIWVVKLDKNGNILWQKCFGGSGNEYASALKQTTDGGFIITGMTESNDGDVQGLHGTNQDIWVVKLDNNGTMEWQKCLGGSDDDMSYDIDLAPNGGYTIVGSTSSEDGDVTGFHPSAPDNEYATNDAWVVNLSNTGQLLWQRAYGGDRDEEFCDVQVLPDHTYLAIGNTDSFNGDVSFSSGYYDCWMVKFDTSGQIIWEKTIHPDESNDDAFGVCSGILPNGNAIIGGAFLQPSIGTWLFEVGAGNTIEGYTFSDPNGNGVRDFRESFFDNVTIRATKNGQVRSSIPHNGYYKIDVDTGLYTIQAVPNIPYYTPVPATTNVAFATFFNSGSANFALQPQAGIWDVNINLFSHTPARPGFDATYQLNYKNVGTEIIGSGQVKLKKDSRLSYISAIPAPASINNDTITWDFNNFSPNRDAVITLNFSIAAPPSVNNGDTLISRAWVLHDLTDATPVDDTISFKQLVTGSFDPNDKSEANAGIITPAQVSKGEYLHYLIRFQNMGTDTAFNITVRDTLDSRLNLNTLQMDAVSHNYQLSIHDGNKLTWQFNNIKLPHNEIDEPGSHGYITYRIKPLSTVKVGDTIKNSAGIYFDYNLPIITNTDNTIVLQLLISLPVTFASFNAFEARSGVQVNWKTSMEENISRFEVQRSSNGIDFTTIGSVAPGSKNYIFNDDNPLLGYNYYRLKSVDIDGATSYSTIALVNRRGQLDIISQIYPNPGRGNINLKLQGKLHGKVSIRITDQHGVTLLLKQLNIQQTEGLAIPLNLERLQAGHYILQITVGERNYLHTLVIQ